jgi:molecular chaperone IbpA
MTGLKFNSNSVHNDPFFIGFDNIVSKLNSTVSNTTGNFPPYNIIKHDDITYTIELAVAGYTREEIDIVLEDGTLTVQGVPQSKESLDYIHRGIAARTFKRVFTLADTIEVTGADMSNGMLLITLTNLIPDAKKPRKIEISSNPKEFLAEG